MSDTDENDSLTSRHTTIISDADNHSDSHGGLYAEENDVLILATSAAKLSFYAPKIKGNLTIGEFVAFRIYNVGTSYGMIVDCKEDSKTVTVLILKELTSARRRHCNVGGIHGGLSSTFKELRVTKFFTKILRSHIISIIFVLNDETIKANKYNVAPSMLNVFVFRFREIGDRQMEVCLLNEFPEEHDRFHQCHSASFSKLLWIDLMNIMHTTTKMLSMKSKTDGVNSYVTASIQASPNIINYIKSNTTFTSNPQETKIK